MSPCGRAKEAGLQRGDYITTIDGADIKSLGSVEAVQNKLRGESGTSVNVGWLDSENAQHTADLTHSGFTANSVDSVLVQGNVGYIKISIPESLDEAAEIDGANKFTTYFRIIFPMMKPMHATTMIINALWFWNDFMLPLLVLNRDSKMWTLPLFQYNYAGQYFNDYGPSFASYVVGIISITIVYLFFQRHIIAGMSNGAVK